MKEFADKLKYLRAEKNLSQVKLADILSLNSSTIAKYETCKAVPSVFVLIEIADYFEVTTDYLLGREDDK